MQIPSTRVTQVIRIPRIDRVARVAAAALLLSGPILFAASAAGDHFAEHFVDGNVLYQQLVRGNAGATGYVVGVADGVQIAQYHLPAADRLFCTPTVATGQELARVVRAHLQANPEIRTYPAAILVVRALAAAFPCGNT